MHHDLDAGVFPVAWPATGAAMPSYPLRIGPPQLATSMDGVATTGENCAVDTDRNEQRGITWTEKQNHSYNFASARVLAMPGNEKAHSQKWAQTLLYMVAGDGIEPPTRGFSIPCSTN